MWVWGRREEIWEHGMGASSPGAQAKVREQARLGGGGEGWGANGGTLLISGGY